MKIEFPSNFLFGTATASTQIEGGDKNSNWYRWSQLGKVINNESCFVATDHYNRYKEDIALMKDLNNEVYRMSLEWSVIEPRNGEFSESGIKHYRDELQCLIDANIKPLVTLHHFSHPQWFEDLGQFTSDDSVKYFIRYVEKVVDELGDLISEFCTINEPNVFLNFCYMDGSFPPGHKGNIKEYFKASKNMIISHLEAYELIHRKRLAMGYDDTLVGMAMHIAYLEPATKRPINKITKAIVERTFHNIFLEGFINGKIIKPLKGKRYPKGKKIFCDFLGINYYARYFVQPTKLNVVIKENLSDENINDMGWEIYPKGFYHVLKRVWDKYRLPIFVTENGIPDAKDRKRVKFLVDHLEQVSKLIKEDVDVQRYYYWSLLDNFEWVEGYDPRFGLIEVDYDNNLKRTIRNSGYFYKEITINKEINDEMVKKYGNK